MIILWYFSNYTNLTSTSILQGLPWNVDSYLSGQAVLCTQSEDPILCSEKPPESSPHFLMMSLQVQIQLIYSTDFLSLFCSYNFYSLQGLGSFSLQKLQDCNLLLCVIIETLVSLSFILILSLIALPIRQYLACNCYVKHFP